MTTDIKALIKSDSFKQSLAQGMAECMTPERLTRVALTAIHKTPALMQCSKESISICLLDCAALGIEPDGRRAHLIPYGKTCKLIIDYKGIAELVRRSGEVADLHADIVCENDEFEYEYGTNQHLTHKPSIKDRGEVYAAYSFVKLLNGEGSFDVMSADEISAIRARSKAKNDGPWKTDPYEMAKKTVFRRHSKWLPLSVATRDKIDRHSGDDIILPTERNITQDVDAPDPWDAEPGKPSEPQEPQEPDGGEPEPKITKGDEATEDFLAELGVRDD
jgi:recombination protein RecT